MFVLPTKIKFASLALPITAFTLGQETVEDLVPAFFLPARSRVFVPQHWCERSEGELAVPPLKRLVTELRQALL
jgi:hypothetical protein